MQAIENLDERVIKPVYDGLKEAGVDFRMLVMPDHPTPIRLRTHTSNPVPYMIYDSTSEQDNAWHYNEAEAENSGHNRAKGYELMGYFLQK